MNATLTTMPVLDFVPTSPMQLPMCDVRHLEGSL